MSAAPAARPLALAAPSAPPAADPITPVFVLSAPRSGSTLVQRVLSVHRDVATASEPWLLLPLLAPLRERFPPGGRWHVQVSQALHDFTATLPGGADDYRAAMRAAALRLYRDAAGPQPRFYLDKTPPYALLADELLATFPDARVLILWRNPLAVVASIVETFCGGRWRPDDYAVSLFAGLDALVAAARRHAGRVVTARFEQLVGGDPDVWRATAGALGLPFDERALAEFGGVRLDGRLGDPTGVRAYGALSSQPLEKWRATLAPPLRRAWCRRYLRWIGADRLAAMGYALDELLAQLDALPPAHVTTPRDAADLARAFARDAVRAQLSRPRPPSSWRRLLA
ncbi:MAG TPA: sulfotransferase [Conexibacter sp.]|nr:sulfotransferase [Conexibacter sp.]